MSIDAQSHTPPLGHGALTPFYDIVIALMTRERYWRERLIERLAPQSGDVILDVGSGTGSLAVALHKAEPRAVYVGIDPDAEAVARARHKNKKAGSSAQFVRGFLSEDAIAAYAKPNKVVSSLVLHQVPLEQKKRILRQMYEVVEPGGLVCIADYGQQRSWRMRLAFRGTVQQLDGVEDTQPNADGILAPLMVEAGLADVDEAERINTLTGTISLYIGRKPLGWR